MGLWLKQGDDLVPVGGGGGGGSFDGEHVLTGDPANPPAELQVGQLLYDGVEDTGGGAGAATELTQQIVKFDTAGTFEFKKADYPNLAFVNVEAIGGGGAGGTAPANPAGESKASVGGGGGSGGYAFRTLMASDLADVESVVVGAGGTASLTRSMVDGVETVGTGSDGGASLAFGINVHGGTGGQSVQTSAGGDYLVARPGQGGSVYGDNDYGVRGGAGFAPDAQVQRSMGGNGGGVMFAVGGFGGNAVTATGQGGANGHNGGGGGGGANRANTDAVQVGGAGGDGIVVVTVFSVTGSGGGGDAGPHDHDEFALVEHDHDEFVHDHDYLPLAGGKLTGGLTVEDRLTLAGETTPLMLVNRGETRVGYFGVPGAQAGIDGELHLRSDKALILQGVDGVRLLQSDLTVDGKIQASNLQVDGNVGFKISSSNTPGYEVGELKAGDGASLRLYSEGDANYANRILVNGALLDLDGSCSLLVRGNATVKGDLQVDGTITGTLAFGITEGIDTRDVLERAETATMPAVDEEGVATADVKGVMLNDVVTALLLKVKELSATVADQTEKIAALEAN